MTTKDYWLDPCNVIYGLIWFVVGFAIGYFLGVA